MPPFYESDFAAIDLGQVADYLISKGWVLQEQVANKATIWDSANGRYEVWLPLRRDFRDFRRVVESMLSTLETVEDRPSQAILRDMAMRWADVSRFRINNGDFGYGNIPLPSGMKLLGAARETIASSARWLTEKKAVYYTRPQERISEFLRRLQMGQTEIGSFVLTVISPLHEISAEFSRAAMAQVFSAISEANDLAGEAISVNSLEVFSEAVHKGVNANLCAALSDLGSLNPDGAVDIRFTWARQERLQTPTGDVVQISPMHLRVIDEAKDWLKRLEPDEKVTLTGIVSVTKERGGEGDYRESELEIKARVDGRPQTVRLNVRGHWRHLAFEATERRLPIRVQGLLDRSRIPFVLNDVSIVEIIQQPEIMSLLDDLISSDD